MTRNEPTLTTREQNLACLYVIRWARYLRSPHVRSKADLDHEFKRLLAKKQAWANDGRMPIPDDQEPPDIAHVIITTLGDAVIHDPTNQEAYLTVELIGRSIEFLYWKHLNDWNSQPYAWFGSGLESTQAQRVACRQLLDRLAEVLPK
jgi:hypothetical protein